MKKRSAAAIFMVLVFFNVNLWWVLFTVMMCTHSVEDNPSDLGNGAIEILFVTAHIGIYSNPENLSKRAALRTVLKLSLPSDFSYEFVFSLEMVQSEMPQALAAELLMFNDTVVLSEPLATSTNYGSHYKTLRWLKHAMREKPFARYFVKTEDDTFVSYPRLKQLISTLNPKEDFVYFGRDDTLHASNSTPTKTYMVGFLYGLSNTLAKFIVSNFTGIVSMVEGQAYSEDLQTAHWVHLLEKTKDSFDGKLSHAYSRVQSMTHKAIPVVWVDWAGFIGQPKWLNVSGWTTQLNNETVALHGIQKPGEFFQAFRLFCDCLSSSSMCRKLDRYWKSRIPGF